MSKANEQDAQTKLRSELKRRDSSRRKGIRSEAEAQAKLHGQTRNDLLPRLELEIRLLVDLKSAHRRLRKANEGHILSVVASIKKLGVCRPIIIDPNGGIVDGHIVAEAARRAGLTEVPCIVVRHLTAAESELLSITLNRLGEQGEWDLAVLDV